MALITDDMDIRDTALDMWVGGNGDYYLELKETKFGKVIKLDTRIAMSGGNATPRIQSAIAELYRALNELSDGKECSDELPASNCIKPAVSSSFCNCHTSKEELHYSYCVPVCFKCNKVVQLQND